jgi:outer membrane protein TolC
MPANFRRTCILLLAFLHAPFPLASFGQQTAASSSGIVQLTLKQAVQLALRQNPQRVISRLLVFESDRNSQIARSPLLPHAEVEANGSVNQYNFQSIEHGRRQDIYFGLATLGVVALISVAFTKLKPKLGHHHFFPW